MGYKEFKAEFNEKIGDARAANDDVRLMAYFDLMIQTLFEINGNLDSLAANYAKLVKIQEAKQNGK